MTLKELSSKLYNSKILDDYKDGKIDYNKINDFIVNLEEEIEISDHEVYNRLAKINNLTESHISNIWSNPYGDIYYLTQLGFRLKIRELKGNLKSKYQSDGCFTAMAALLLIMIVILL